MIEPAPQDIPLQPEQLIEPGGEMLAQIGRMITGNSELFEQFALTATDPSGNFKLQTTSDDVIERELEGDVAFYGIESRDHGPVSLTFDRRTKKCEHIGVFVGGSDDEDRIRPDDKPTQRRVDAAKRILDDMESRLVQPSPNVTAQVSRPEHGFPH